MDRSKTKQSIGNGAVPAANNAPDISDTHFSRHQATCPICEAQSWQYDYRNEIYIISERDMDYRPTKYVWKTKTHMSFNPLFYHIWRCPSCSYAASRQYFEEPTADISLSKSKFQKLVSEFLLSEDLSVGLKPLATQVEAPAKMEFIDAVKLHLNAIAILERVSSVRTRDSLPLGKYYLRLSWLYHEMLQLPDESEASKLMKALELSLQDNWPDLPVNEKSTTVKALHYYDTAFFHSRIPERKRITHVVSQVLARLQIKTGAVSDGRNLLLKSIQYCGVHKNQTIDELKYTTNTSESYREQLKHRIDSYNKFISETQELIYSTRNKKESER